VHEERPDASPRTAARFAVVAAVLGFLAVALGAFGAHGLEGAMKDLPDGAKRLAWWRTGVDYHFWHALLAAVLVALVGKLPAKRLALSLGCIVAGVVLFSGSLYAMTLTGVTALGMVTPIGGVAFLAGWAALGWAALSSGE
jgi:uncharacterized membrane protein YgdD (TMEM256/DUF423 family)